MYVHISQKVFDRRQLLVLLLAAATLVFMLVAYGVLYREYTGFGIAPEEIDLKTVIPPQQNHGRWVRITQPLELQCDRGIQESLLGKIGSTYYLAQVSGSDPSVLLDYEGNTTCEAMSPHGDDGSAGRADSAAARGFIRRGVLFSKQRSRDAVVLDVQSPTVQEYGSVERIYSTLVSLFNHPQWQEISTTV